MPSYSPWLPIQDEGEDAATEQYGDQRGGPEGPLSDFWIVRTLVVLRHDLLASARKRLDVGDDVAHRRRVLQRARHGSHLGARHVLRMRAPHAGLELLELGQKVPVRLLGERRRVQGLQ